MNQITTKTISCNICGNSILQNMPVRIYNDLHFTFLGKTKCTKQELQSSNVLRVIISFQDLMVIEYLTAKNIQTTECELRQIISEIYNYIFHFESGKSKSYMIDMSLEFYPIDVMGENDIVLPLHYQNEKGDIINKVSYKLDSYQDFWTWFRVKNHRKLNYESQSVACPHMTSYNA